MEFGARPEISEEVAFSRRVSSPQLGPHPGLEQLLRRHSQSRFLRPIADFSRVALEPLFVSASAEQQQVVLDLGCGVGESTLVLARKHPAAKVIGIDKSAIRLARFAQFDAPQNAQVVRADSVDALLLAQELELQLAAVYLWYPNPWPKKKHLQRR